MLAEHQFVGIPANIFGTHDFVGFPMLEYPILMNSRLVRKGVRADNRLVRLHGKSGNAGDHLGRSNNLRRVDASHAWKYVLPRMNCHDNFFQRGIACTLAKTIYGAFDLACACHDGSEAVRNGKTQVKVAGYDALDEAITEIKAGKMVATIDQQAAEQGYQGIALANSLSQGAAVPAVTLIDTRLVTAKTSP